MMNSMTEEGSNHLDENESDSLFDIEKLFINEDYVQRLYTFNDINISLLCSPMSSTDHDLTGQIIWPASLLLSWFISSNRSLFAGKNVIELGAGCGLAGFLAAKLSKQVVITDGNDVVLRLLERNKELLHENDHSVQIKSLQWGIKQQIENIYWNNETCIPSISDSIQPQIIIGADVILWPNYVYPLLKTIRWLLYCHENKYNSVCYISYICRAHSTTDLVYRYCKELKLSIQSINIDSFLFEPVPTCLQSLEKYLFEIKLDSESEDISGNFMSEASQSEVDIDNFIHTAAPC